MQCRFDWDEWEGNVTNTTDEQIKELKKALEQLLFHAPENDIFDLYGACEMESDDWSKAKDKARQILNKFEKEDGCVTGSQIR